MQEDDYIFIIQESDVQTRTCMIDRYIDEYRLNNCSFIHLKIIHLLQFEWTYVAN